MGGLQRRTVLATLGTVIGTSGCLGRVSVGTNPPKGVDSTDLFVSGERGYPVYRIPALLTTTEGTILAFCEGRRSQAGDRVPTDILVRRSTDGGQTWADQEVVTGGSESTFSNPTPVQDQESGIILLPVTRDYRDQLMIRSSDDGRTWSSPENITGSVKRPDWGYYATGPGRGIQTNRGENDGRLIIPATHWTHLWEGEVPDDNVRYDHVIYSDDGGKTWEFGGTVAPHVDEPQAVELPDGRLMFNMRNYWGTNGRPAGKGVRAVSTSPDGGKSWSDIRFDQTLESPICQASIIRYSWPEDGQSRLLFSNPANRGSRVDLTVRMSYDEGTSWSHARTLHPNAAAYSCLARLPDGSVGCLFEGGMDNPYERIIFRRFSLEWLTEGPKSK